VPYTGATTNVNLGEFELKAGQMTLDITPTGTAAVGTTRWNDAIGSSETTLKGGSVILKNGVDLVARVVNKVSPNTTLTKAAYQAVRVSGAQGQRLAVALAQANNDNNSADTIGLVTETIATNQEGFIITVGQLENINTTGSLQGETWADGDVIYLSPTTAGRLTNLKPVAPQHIIVIGYVEYAHANNGKLYVKVMNGWELGELHDVDTTGATNGQVLKYNGTIWTPSGDVGITSLNGLNATSQTFATGSSGTDFNISSATSTHTFNLPTASGTNRGLLSSADWTTFNSKQNALTNPITGTAAAGQVAYFTGATTQGGSANLTWDNTNNRFKINNQFLAGNEQTFNVYGSALFQQSIGDAQKIYIGNNTSLGTGDGRLLITPNRIKLNDRLTGLTISADNLDLGGFIAMNGRDSDAGSTVVGAANIQTIKIFGATRNVAIQNGGTFTDSGQRLQVTGDTLVSGDTITTGSYRTSTYNYASSLTLSKFEINSSAVNATDRILDFGDEVRGWNITGLQSGGGNGRMSFNARSFNVLTEAVRFELSANSIGGAIMQLPFTGVSFAPTSGSGVFTGILMTQTINQTGGANGITRGLLVNPTLTAAADWRSIEWSNNTGWGLYGAGTANNYLGGRLGIGSTNLVFSNLRVSNAVTGGINSSVIFTDSVIQSDVTSTATGFYSGLSTAAASFTLSNLRHFIAQVGSFGAGSTVTEQAGFVASSNLTGATNNYGFLGSIPSGTGRWNLYMNGTANNYMAGNLLIGTTTVGMKLTVIDTGVTYVAQFRGGSSSYITVGDTSLGGESGINFRNSSGQGFLALAGTVLGMSATSGANTITLATSGTIGVQLTTNRNLILQNGGTFTDSGERLQVTGTAKITGATSFGGNMTLSLNQNAFTKIEISNTTSGTGSASVFVARSSSGGTFELSKNSATTTSYKIASTNDGVLYNFAGDIAILNDNATGNIKFGAGASSTAQMTLTSAGNLCIGVTSGGDFLNIAASTTAKAQINLAAGTAPTSPNDGDIWFDGTNLKMQIGGVTKTFTLT
jgi:hypothetical protein